MTSVNLTAGTLTVVRGYDGTTPSVHAAGAYVALETPVLPAPSDFKMVLTQSSGNSFQATLYNLDTANTLGQVNFNMPPGVANLALEGGPGNNVIDVESSVTEDVSIFGGPGNNTLMAGSGDDTLVAGSGTGVLYGGSGADVLYGGDLPAAGRGACAGFHRELVGARREYDERQRDDHRPGHDLRVDQGSDRQRRRHRRRKRDQLDRFGDRDHNLESGHRYGQRRQTRFRFEHARGAGHAHCRQRQQRTVRRQRRRRLDRLYGHPADWPVRARIRRRPRPAGGGLG